MNIINSSDALFLHSKELHGPFLGHFSASGLLFGQVGAFLVHPRSPPSLVNGAGALAIGSRFLGRDCLRMVGSAEVPGIHHSGPRRTSGASPRHPNDAGGESLFTGARISAQKHAGAEIRWRHARPPRIVTRSPRRRAAGPENNTITAVKKALVQLVIQARVVEEQGPDGRIHYRAKHRKSGTMGIPERLEPPRRNPRYQYPRAIGQDIRRAAAAIRELHRMRSWAGM